MSRNAALLDEVDVVFLDIEMPEKNGLELAEQILEIKPTLAIVFVTAFNDYAVQAFELNTLDYLVKPVQLDRLQKTLERIENEITYRVDQSLSFEHDLRVNVCGELTFEFINDEFEVIQWRTIKAQELFLYLLLHSEKTVRKSELVELLWPDINQSRAYSQLYTAIYQVRKTLDDHGLSTHLSIKNVAEGYILSIKNTLIDIVEWENKVKTVPPINSKNAADYEVIMDLYTGSYLAGYDYLWAEPERYRLEQLWLRTAYRIASFYNENNDLEKAGSWFVKICDLRPENEIAHFSLMKLYDSIGYGVLVGHQFTQLKKALEDIGIEVSPSIQSWYNQWNLNRKKQKLSLK